MGLSKYIVSYLPKIKRKTQWVRYFSSRNFKKPPWKVLFFGADDFSIFTLESLAHEYRTGKLISQLEVVTTVKGKSNPVKLFSDEKKLNLFKWPPNIAYGQFDVGLVVSFGHLIPKDIIEKFEFGMLNVHASLLPRWRGAAPIIYAVANGDTETGITIMKISPEKFDIGEIVCQESVQIHSDMKMKELHTILGKIGAKNLITTLETLPVSLSNAKPQPSEGVTYAPKVNAELSRVNWAKMTSQEIYNLTRALDGIFYLQTMWNDITVKLVDIRKTNLSTDVTAEKLPGYIQYDRKSQRLKILCADLQYIMVEKIGLPGKKIMSSKDFNNGYIKKELPNCRYFK